MSPRRWSAEEADGWGWHDGVAIVLSPLVYFLLTLGTALALLLRWQGAVLLAVGIVLAVVMHRVIDPKLKAISEDYEHKQQAYLEELEVKVRWQETSQ